ncbi:MAG: N-6 DNA methylase [Kiritimatiellaceae bacterium]|nr:N-6 DNA methylase [Kiritimatiellaceae bacterium]
MLDSETKRRIDTARDILVGKVPDPKSQVEQITIALIYKFMDDMDAEAEELGGKRKFFTKEFARYGWAKLMSPSLGGHEMRDLYKEGLAKMPENPGIPPLFRDILKDADLPYRDPETLKSFLKIINGFTYDHSEKLGDAFEYLLSVLGSQGDAGQFRTPRHIIDFMVEVIAPKKGEVILDPACGTAGFLISAYKHILKAHDPSNRANPSAKPLTPDERGKMAKNFRGYDISPDMVRLSLVNLYLHGFADPHIVEYDTLTSEERWNEYADVILANPPFMSPKGGIKPHKRFSIQAKRSEVLFVDYMAEHLTPTGRAAIIVPEGIIFQSQTAYKQLRKMLVENSLVAVVSLPAGCFNPYSGVKTSILILDKALAKKSDTIAFVKIENDGYGLGAQRRAVAGSDLPDAATFLKGYFNVGRVPPRGVAESRDPVDNQAGVADVGRVPPRGVPLSDAGSGDPAYSNTQIVPKSKIAANGDYNLSGERYREGVTQHSIYPRVLLEEIAEVRMGETLIKGDLTGKGKAIFSADSSDEPWAFSEPTRLSFGKNTLVIGARGTIGSVKFPNRDCFTCTQTTIAITAAVERILPEFLYHWLKAFDFKTITEGVGIPMITVANVNKFEIPLPPLEIQKEIVAEIEGYQKVINGARAVLDHYRPHIPIHPDWPMVELGNVVSYSSGGTPSKANESYWIGDIPWVSAKDMKSDVLSDASTHVSKAAVKESATQIAPVGSLLILVRGMGLANGVPICELAKPCAFNQDVKAMKPHASVNSTFLRVMLKQEEPQFRKILETAAHGTLKINTDDLSAIKFPLPPLAEQQAIVAEIEAEQKLVSANRELITRFEQKIQATLARIWGCPT